MPPRDAARAMLFRRDLRALTLDFAAVAGECARLGLWATYQFVKDAERRLGWEAAGYLKAAERRSKKGGA